MFDFTLRWVVCFLTLCDIYWHYDWIICNMKTTGKKDWISIRLTNNRRQKARIKRLLEEQWLQFPEHMKLRFEADMAMLLQEEKELLEQLNMR